ncbi:hypothetical protein BMR06_06035 [Methylococcaceae bacterium HT5]|nr:hypothetical protein BMR06_06035 [Methylococcaceae bacterium HT5]
MAWQKKDQPAIVSLEHFVGDRQEIRHQAVYKLKFPNNYLW